MTMRTFAAPLALFVLVSSCKTAGVKDATTGPLPASSVLGPSAPPISVAETTLAPIHPEPTVTLTASDGTGLTLVRLAARAVVDEPLALTEVALAFENPLARNLEGTFRFTLPQGATVSRFAMKVGEQWQEGEVVEKQAARRTYEDFLHKKQDPALLEQAAGNEFSARVFPIPPHGIKEIVVSYSQELPGGAGYVLPLRGLPELGHLEVELTRAGDAEPAVTTHEDHIVPSDVKLPPRDTDTPLQGLTSGGLVLARVRPVVDEAPEPLGSAVVLFDTSASRALGLADQLNVLTRIVGGMVERSGPDASLAVVCFDQSTESVFEGKAAAFGANEVARIERRGALGASDLASALEAAGALAKKSGYKRVVVITDGVATAGAVKDDELVKVTRALGESGVDRVDAVAVGGIREDAGLRRVVTAGLPHDGVVADGALDEPSLARRLTLATRSGIAVKVPGAKWWWPRTLDGVQPGDERSVYAELGKAESTLRLDVGGTASDVKLRAAPKPLLERTWAQAKITSLLDEQASHGNDPAVPKQIVALSVAHRVVSPYTAMIVLETQADYDRFHIDRTAVADILTVDHGAIAVANRSSLHKAGAFATKASAPSGTDSNASSIPTFTGAMATATASAPVAPPTPQEVEDGLREAASFGMIGALDTEQTQGAAPGDPASARGALWGADVGDSFGAGGLGLSGAGEGGGGSGEGIGLGSAGGVGQGFGHGRLAGAHTPRAPTMREGATVVSGRLPPEVIQRIVRQNFGRFRACYEEGLRRDHTLTGRVAVRFMIDRSGSVAQTEDGGSDLPNPDVVACVVRSFSVLSFPEPAGGLVTVVYPIVFSPEGEGNASPPQAVSPMPAAPRPPPPLASPWSGPGSPSSGLEVTSKPAPYTGRFKIAMDAVEGGNAASARSLVSEWHASDPGDVLGLVALGEVLEATGDIERAARAYGSIIDLFPARADLRRFAGERLEHLRGGAGVDLAIDTYAKAKEERPDHPSSHRLLAFAWLKKGAYAKAFDAALDGMRQHYPERRFAGVQQVLREDLGLIAAAWIHAEPKRRAEIQKRVVDAGGTLEESASLRFVLTWETDANDVDFHITDGHGNHAFYGSPALATGGRLYADVTTGYGPECFTIRAPKGHRVGPYTLQANYYSRGPMGYGMGKLEIIDHDGAGNLVFTERPYVVMVDHAFVDLGSAG
jgi:hypothetical protein